LPLDPPHEKRYPYLDRDLLEFLFAIPREQIVRPGQRRSLMRRSLMGIVPDEVINRKRKAFLSRAPIAAIRAQWFRLEVVKSHMALSSFGIVRADAFGQAVEKARNGMQIQIVTLIRTLWIESWLRSLLDQGVLDTSGVSDPFSTDHHHPHHDRSLHQSSAS
jgi:asparagine synthase (glutamine-hydrolysing)